MYRLVAQGLLLAMTITSCFKEEEVKPDPARSTDLPRARDPNIAVQEELDAARRSGTVAAYDLFLARHGDHPLAEAARREREALPRRRRD
jgi:hypothetical protein